MTPYIYPGVVQLKPTEPDIRDAVARVTGVTFEQAQNRWRPDKTVMYRTLYWFLLNKYFNTDTIRLGLIFGRDHSTVLHGLKKCRNKYDIKLQKNIVSCEVQLLPKIKVVGMG